MTRRDLRSVLRNAALVSGALGILVVLVAALFGPQLAPFDPQAQRVVVFFPDGDYAIPPTPPSPHYPLGTDPIGRDILSRLLWGARLTLVATFLAVLGRAFLGIVVGFAAGWRRGALDALARYATNALSGFPQLMLALFLVVMLKEQGLLGFVIALAAVGWSELAQFVRAEVIRLRAAPYVDAARAIGARTPRIVVSHVARNLAPQLVGLVALEAGSVLILLAELGFIGFFIGGGTFYTDDQGHPILPVRERAPEWGQMLAGARGYAYVQQWVAFVPALVVASAVFAFNLFGEGIREAIDPFSPRRLHPRLLGGLWRGTVALGLVGLVAFGGLTLRSAAPSFADALSGARGAVARELPGGELVAAVVRFRSDAHALSRPAKVNFYFRRPGESELLRVGYPDANPDAMEVKHYDQEDDLDYGALAPIGESEVSFEEALGIAERRGGLAFRNNTVQYTVVAILQRLPGLPGPVWRVRYGRPTSAAPVLDYLIDARTGALGLPYAFYLADAEPRARQVIGGQVELVGVVATWFGPHERIEEELPSQLGLHFLDATDRTRTVTVSYATATGLAAQTLPGRVFEGSPPIEGSRPPPPAPLPSRYTDAPATFRLVEAAGGAAVHADADRAGKHWRAEVTLQAAGRPTATVSYALFEGAPGSARFEFAELGTFRVDLESLRVERLR